MSFFICSQRYGGQEGKGRQIVTFVEWMMVDGSDDVGAKFISPERSVSGADCNYSGVCEWRAK
jgi:hypothetical protein